MAREFRVQLSCGADFGGCRWVRSGLTGAGHGRLPTHLEASGSAGDSGSLAVVPDPGLAPRPPGGYRDWRLALSPAVGTGRPAVVGGWSAGDSGSPAVPPSPSGGSETGGWHRPTRSRGRLVHRFRLGGGPPETLGWLPGPAVGTGRRAVVGGWSVDSGSPAVPISSLASVPAGPFGPSGPVPGWSAPSVSDKGRRIVSGL